MALIVLRACVLGSLWMEALSRESFVFASWTGIGLTLLCLFIASGTLTPVVCLICIVIELWLLLLNHVADPFHLVLSICLILVLALLGPGAFSVDAQLFGRRRILPRRK